MSAGVSAAAHFQEDWAYFQEDSAHVSDRQRKFSSAPPPGGSRGSGANGQDGDGSSDDSADETPPARDRSSFNEEI
ncbi:hypothetical protein SAPIO_CDS10140 [Scedosporium apiospermum]|uniref:Uncharacterized protein n=1 Tax=Pseudallescheria apiosperma TaxID=563466 RepID=A0A084FWG1_PSEDA|nr:uncharacterized protein SAPIO_CDS10140 [Scedosporium apiospermum]KEZ39423.1 hypothetical protein SAPIO_CDS10140 [Scedosporium apiospermum]